MIKGWKESRLFSLQFFILYTMHLTEQRTFFLEMNEQEAKDLMMSLQGLVEEHHLSENNPTRILCNVLWNKLEYSISQSTFSSLYKTTMKVSELIEKLQFAQKNIGDVDVKIVEILMNQECYEDEVYVGIGGDNDVVEVGVAKVIESEYEKRFNRIMKIVDDWADEYAGWDCREEAVEDVRYILSNDEYKDWSDERIANDAIKAWEMAEQLNSTNFNQTMNKVVIPIIPILTYCINRIQKVKGGRYEKYKATKVIRHLFFNVWYVAADLKSYERATYFMNWIKSVNE